MLEMKSGVVDGACYFLNLSQGLQKCDLKVDSVLQVF